MLRVTLSVFTLLFSGLLQAEEANPLYQIDVIVFTFQKERLSPENSLSSTLAALPSNALSLSSEREKNLTPYHLLPISSSHLQEAFWALHRQAQFKVLLNYSWLQPFSNQKTMVFPEINRDGWHLEGSLRVERSNYYLVETQLLLAHDNSPQPPVVFSQKQRLKGGEIYYFDHPEIGMVIKVHQLT